MQTIKLDHPITVNGAAYSELTMRRAKLRDEMAIEKKRKIDPIGAEVQLFCSLCEVETAVIEELDMADYGKLQETYTGFTKPPKDEA